MKVRGKHGEAPTVETQRLRVKLKSRRYLIKSRRCLIKSRRYLLKSRRYLIVFRRDLLYHAGTRGLLTGIAMNVGLFSTAQHAIFRAVRLPGVRVDFNRTVRKLTTFYISHELPRSELARLSTCKRKRWAKNYP